MTKLTYTRTQTHSVTYTPYAHTNSVYVRKTHMKNRRRGYLHRRENKKSDCVVKFEPDSPILACTSNYILFEIFDGLSNTWPFYKTKIQSVVMNGIDGGSSYTAMLNVHKSLTTIRMSRVVHQKEIQIKSQ